MRPSRLDLFEQVARAVYHCLAKEAITTVPIDILINLTMGSSVALVARRSVAEDGLVRSVPLVALLAFQFMIFVPIGVRFLWLYPDWMLMYLTDPAQLPIPVWTLALSFPAAAMVGFFVVRNLIRQSKGGAAIGWTLGCLSVALAVGGFGHRQLLRVGTSETYRNDLPMQPLAQTPLYYMLIAAVAAIVLGWAATLWRLAVYSRASRHRTGQLEQTLVRNGHNDGNTKPLAASKPPAPRKKPKSGRRASPRKRKDT